MIWNTFEVFGWEKEDKMEMISENFKYGFKETKQPLKCQWLKQVQDYLS